MHACVDTVEYLPATHAMQLVPPFRASESVTEPAAQLVQAVAELGEYCPAAHDVHLVPEDETTESLEPAVTTDPEVHALIDDWGFVINYLNFIMNITNIYNITDTFNIVIIYNPRPTS